MTSTHFNLLNAQQFTKSDIINDDINLKYMKEKDVMTYLDESLDQTDPAKMSHKAKPGLAIINYLKESMGHPDDPENTLEEYISDDCNENQKY